MSFDGFKFLASKILLILYFKQKINLLDKLFPILRQHNHGSEFWGSGIVTILSQYLHTVFYACLIQSKFEINDLNSLSILIEGN